MPWGVFRPNQLSGAKSQQNPVNSANKYALSALAQRVHVHKQMILKAKPGGYVKMSVVVVLSLNMKKRVVTWQNKQKGKMSFFQCSRLIR